MNRCRFVEMDEHEIARCEKERKKERKHHMMTTAVVVAVGQRTCSQEIIIGKSYTYLVCFPFSCRSIITVQYILGCLRFNVNRSSICFYLSIHPELDT